MAQAPTARGTQNWKSCDALTALVKNTLPKTHLPWLPGVGKSSSGYASRTRIARTKQAAMGHFLPRRALCANRQKKAAAIAIGSCALAKRSKRTVHNGRGSMNV